MYQDFIVTSKRKNAIKPFFEVYEARYKDQSKNNYLVEIYNFNHTNDQDIEQSLEFNQAIFTDTFTLSTANIVKIIDFEKSESLSLHFVEKYDKTLEQYIKSNKKGRFSQEICLIIMQDILKGLATILEGGYRPVSLRADNVVRCFSKNPEERQDIWKIKNVVYSSSFFFEPQNFLTFQEIYSPPEIYNRRNNKDHEFQESQEYVNGLLVWSLGIIFAKMLGIEGKLDSKRKLSSFRDREFNIFDILYIRKEYSQPFLKMVSSMLHFDNKRRMKLKDLFGLPLFSAQLSRGVKKLRSPVQQQMQKVVLQMKNKTGVECSLFQIMSLC